MVVVSHEVLEGIWVWNGNAMSCKSLLSHGASVIFKVPVDTDRSEAGISSCWNQVMLVTPWEPICEDVDALCRFAPLGSVKR